MGTLTGSLIGTWIGHSMRRPTRTLIGNEEYGVGRFQAEMKPRNGKGKGKGVALMGKGGYGEGG